MSAFYHPGGGRHKWAYYGVSFGFTGKIKVVDPKKYVAASDDNATIIYYGE